jgi:template-activating factor I
LGVAIVSDLFPDAIEYITGTHDTMMDEDDSEDEDDEDEEEIDLEKPRKKQKTA